MDTKSRFLKFSNNDISIRDINLEFLKKMDRWMIKKEYSVTTRSIHFRSLKAIINDHKDLIEKYPFDGFKIRQGRARKNVLTKEQIEALKSANIKDKGREMAQKVFLFSYYTRGMNIKDMAKLKKSNIKNNAISFIRQKTEDTEIFENHIIINITPAIQEIIDYFDFPYVDYLFPIFNDKVHITAEQKHYRTQTFNGTINKLLKELHLENDLKETDFPDNITFGWARHTYATILYRSGIAIGQISAALGHSSESTTRHYINSIEQAEIDELSQHL